MFDAHTMELAIGKGIKFLHKQFPAIMQRIHGTVNYFRTSTQSKALLKSIQRKSHDSRVASGLTSSTQYYKPVGVVQYVPTRWHMFCDMLSRLMFLKDSISLFCLDDYGKTARSSDSWLKDADWEIMESVLTVLL
jgi:hypothetical protein